MKNKKAAHTFLLGLFTPTGEGRSLKMKLIAYFGVIALLVAGDEKGLVKVNILPQAKKGN